MLTRLRTAVTAAMSAWRSNAATTAKAAPAPYSAADLAAALARIMIATCHRHALEPGDTTALHLLSMRRYDLSPVAYAARCAKVSPERMLALAHAAVEPTILELTRMPGQGWELPDLHRGVAAITTVDAAPDSLLDATRPSRPIARRQ